MTSTTNTLALVGGFMAVGIVYPANASDEKGDPIVLETPPRFAFESTQPTLEDESAAPSQLGRILVRGGFVSVQVNVDQFGDNIPGDAANEPSIAVNFDDPSRLVIGWRQFDTIRSDFRQAGWAYSHDGGQAWTFPGVLEPGVFQSDPVLEADADGVFYYYSLRIEPTFACDMYISTDGGVSWEDPNPAFGGDKAWMAIDRTGGLGHGHIYTSWSWAAACCGLDTFTRSTDGGFDFLVPIFIPPAPPVFGTMSVGPDGELYTAGIDFPSFSNGNFLIVRSSNAQDPDKTPTFDLGAPVNMGGSLTGASGPNPAGLLGQTWVATDHSDGPTRGNVYMLCSVDPQGSDPLDVHFVRSQDGGATWSAPIRVNDDPNNNGAWQWFGTMSVAPNGRIDVIWNDTRNDPADNFSELFYSSSSDAGVTWSKNVALSAPFDHSLGYPQQQKLGDYYDMISDNTGAHIAYAATFNGEQDVYYLRIDVAEEPGCEGDANGDGVVDPLDSGFVLARFGCPVGTGDPSCDAADQNGDGVVDPLDSGFVLARFGECP